MHDLYLQNKKKVTKSSATPLKCYLCKKELNGISITGKNIKGKTVFLCSYHYEFSSPHAILVS